MQEATAGSMLTAETCLSVDQDSSDYSFAIEYRGPPLPYEVPKAEAVFPVIDRNTARCNSGTSSSASSSSSLLRKKPPDLRLILPRLSLGDLLSNSDACSSPVQGLIERPLYPFASSSPSLPTPPPPNFAFAPSDASLDSSTPVLETSLHSFPNPASQTVFERPLPYPIRVNPPVSNHCSSPAPDVVSPVALDFPSKSEPAAAPTPSLESQDDTANILNDFPRTPETSVAKADSLFPKLMRRGKCSRCLKASGFLDKETCLVCNAKYCCNCLLLAMGSMPEGRKCVSCMGKPIDESKRSSLGKCSRFLNRILSPLEVQQIMIAERECPANRLRPEQVVVNGRQLRAEELADLLGCSNPPFKLKPGSYWYDKQSGLWGKDGEKPHKIITAELNVGGVLQDNASGGKTDVRINGRQITTTELKMLKFAGVQCPAGTHLWVYPDGSYQEEGQNNIKGNIWKKGTTKFLYPFFSLPTPCNSSNISSKIFSHGSVQAVSGDLEQRKNQKLLLLGLEGSGTSTIFKQAKLLYKGEGFTQEELLNIKLMIQQNIYKYISVLLEGREMFEEEEEEEEEEEAQRSIEGQELSDEEVAAGTEEALENLSDGPDQSRENLSFKLSMERLPDCTSAFKSGNAEGKASPARKNMYSMNARLKYDADWFLEITANGSLDAFFPAASQVYAPIVEEMWKDSAIQATYGRKSELHMFPEVADFFLERVVEVSTNEYEPNEQDILFAEGLTQGSGLAELEFFLEDRSPISEAYNENYDMPSAAVRYQLIRINTNGIVKGCKWLELFEGVQAVVFCVAISEYDQLWTNGTGPLKNKMLLSKDLFENIIRHPCFWDTPFVLLLNKYDLFEEKVQTVPLTTCEWFSDFDPVQASRQIPHSLAQQAYTYIAHKYKKLFESANTTGRKLYTFQLNARDRATVGAAFEYIKEILKWEDTKAVACWSILEDSCYSTETSSFSPLVQGIVH